MYTQEVAAAAVGGLFRWSEVGLMVARGDYAHC